MRNDRGGYDRACVSHIENCNIKIQDILQQGENELYPINTVGDKSYAIKRTYHKSSVTNFVNGGCHYPATGVAVFVGDIVMSNAMCIDGNTHKVYEVRDGSINVNGESHRINLKNGYYIIRKLTINECKSLQNIPDWYEFPVSDTQAYRMLGERVDYWSYIPPIESYTVLRTIMCFML